MLDVRLESLWNPVHEHVVATLYLRDGAFCRYMLLSIDAECWPVVVCLSESLEGASREPVGGGKLEDHPLVLCANPVLIMFVTT